MTYHIDAIQKHDHLSLETKKEKIWLENHVKPMVNAKAIWARGSGVYCDSQVHLIIVTCIHLKDLKCMDVHWV